MRLRSLRDCAGLRFERLSCSDAIYFASSTRTRWRTFLSIPATTGPSSCSLERPILPSPSARSVPRCRWELPIWERTCVILSLVNGCLLGGGGLLGRRRLLRHRRLLGHGCLGDLL